MEHPQRLMAALEHCGGSPLLTIYPHLEHDAWTTAYADPELYRWMFDQGGEG